jgi:thiol-disulfide isomerase/thioredoxin
MTRALPVLLLAASPFAAFAQAPVPNPPAPQVPRPAANIGIQTAPEKYTWISEFQGKTCIVAFIMTTCPHCQYTTGILSKIQTDYAAKGVRVIASAIEPMSSLHIPGFVKQFQPTFPVGYNEQGYINKFLGLPENDPMFVPQVVFIDKSGIIRAQFTGDSPEMVKDVQEKKLRETLDRVLAGK